MFDVGGGELILILLAIVVLFGPKKLPELARSMGKGMAMFRKAQMQFQTQINDLKQEISAPLEEVKREIERNANEELAKDVTPKGADAEIKAIDSEEVVTTKKPEDEVLPDEPFSKKLEKIDLKNKKSNENNSLNIN